jgi:hypothetical protein
MATLPTSAAQRTILNAMEPTDGRTMAGGLVPNASRVHVSDASPTGYFGRVTSIHAGTLTVARDDTGARDLVDPSRRRVLVIDP